MAESSNPVSGPDLTRGITLADFGGEKMLRGHVGKKPVLLARVGDDVLAVGAKCTHYGGTLEKGLLVGDTVRCPLHHACFSLRTGEALRAPAFDPLPCWQVERDGERIVVRETIAATRKHASPAKDQPRSVVIIGGGASGFACAEMLRRRGYGGSLTLLSDDADAPYDRPNLSKDYLAGGAPEDWMPLRPQNFYADSGIDLRLQTSVSSIDPAGRRVVTSKGQAIEFERLLIATGAEAVRPPIPGVYQPHVFTLRSFEDSRAIIERAQTARSAVVLGSGFIGLETAAALRERGLDVQVVSLDACPLERVLGRELGDLVRAVHERHGEVFHMNTSIDSIAEESVMLGDGTEITADLVIIGTGVKPRTALAEAAGLAVDHGIMVDEFLETGIQGIFAAGDVARWPYSSSETARVEHWVVAERQGQVVAENILGARTPYFEAPFFWSAHHDVTIRYAGHAANCDEIVIDGSVADHDCMVSYRKEGRTLAVATIGRNLAALQQAEVLSRVAVGG